MKAAELRDLGADELSVKERDLTDQIFRMRIHKSLGQLEAPEKLKTVRRDLARVKTFLRQKRSGCRSGAGTRKPDNLTLGIEVIRLAAAITPYSPEVKLNTVLPEKRAGNQVARILRRAYHLPHLIYSDCLTDISSKCT